MCYSARIVADYRSFVRLYGSTMSLEEFVDLYWHKRQEPGLRTPRAMDRWFDDIEGRAAEQIREHLAAIRGDEEVRLQQEVFQQAARLADAERKLQVKETKAALNDQRIATKKISAAKARLADLHRTERRPADGRFFPGQYAPVIVWQDGRRVIRPMRYQCRLPGWTEAVERKYPGTYNARRDSLGKAWRELFGVRHGVIVIESFYENVARHAAEHRELRPGEAPENIVLEFQPRPAQDMVIACLWNESPEDEGRLLSFAAITDEPAPEVAAAGHDRTIIQLAPHNIDAWLQPEGRSIDALQAILDERPQAYYEHREAA